MTTMKKTTVIVPLGHYVVQKGWYYGELAKQLEMRPSSLADIMSGKRYPQRATRLALCRALGITMDELIDMLTASAELALTGETGQQFSRALAEMRRLAKRIKRPAPVTVSEAKAGQATLTKLIRRGKVTIVVPALRSA